MSRILQISFLMLVLIFNLHSQNPEKEFIGGGAPYKNLDDVAQLLGNVNFVYELELFPGQVFDGSYYYWSTANTVTGNFQINPSVSWLSISPNSITSTSCDDIVRVTYSFIAPDTPGIYNAVIQDLNSIWQNTEVILHVTEAPATAIVRSYQVNHGQTISQFDTLYWNGFGPFGCLENYIPGNERLFSYRELEPVSWISINPSSINVPLFGQGILESTITGDTTGNDFVYIIEEVQYYHLCLFYRVELNVITDVENNNTFINPDEFALKQNYPNPFNPATTIQYSIPQRSNVTLKVYGILGNEVTALVNEEKDRGVYTVNFDASQLASGIYFYRLQAGSFVESKKMLVLK